MMSTIDYYDSNAERYIKDTLHLSMHEFYEPFISLLPRNARILDAGCGSGRDTLFFMKKGFKVTAIDASPEMAVRCADIIGQEVLNLSFEDINFNHEFDGIWANASLLHVPRAKIDSVIIKLIRALRKDGIIYASFKYGDDDVIRDDRLFSNHTELSLRMMIEKHSELDVVAVWSTQSIRQDSKDEKWINALLRKN